jgi:hypothetical protein
VADAEGERVSEHHKVERAKALAWLDGWLAAGGSPKEGIGTAAVRTARSGGKLLEVRVAKDRFVTLVGEAGDVSSDAEGTFVLLATPAGNVVVRVAKEST